ncbi:hypothetical protein [Streptomyces sp. NPDC002962]|uniref:hypothetical protein n=1 Tax=Streptomyces sp. NPDC002962 TaxID=3364674 RepID=UPI0036A7D4D4
MNVEIEPVLRDTAAHLGAGVPYALKVLAGQLAEDPDMGAPSDLPGVLTVMVDGDLFEDCPDLSVGYIREPDWIQIRFSTPVSPVEPSAEVPGPQRKQGREQDQQADPAAAALTVRLVADAFERITGWLKENAPDSYAALRTGADPAALAALEEVLGIRIPIELRVLWLLTAGDDGVNGWGWGCLPGSETLMTPDAAAAAYRSNMDAQAHEDFLNAGRSEYDRITVWKASWIPVVSHGAADGTSGLYLDAETGYLGRWSRYSEGPGEELDTLVTYLEEAADMLESPALATRDTPGLIGGALVWRRGVRSSLKDQWQPLTG